MEDSSQSSKLKDWNADSNTDDKDQVQEVSFGEGGLRGAKWDINKN